jgi:two-component system chemotaxis response regulator CheV
MLDVEKIVADIDPNMAIETGASLEKMIEGKPIAVTAEDSVTIRKMITDRLIKAGFEVKSFNDGKSAWEFLENLPKTLSQGESIFKKCSIIITDIEMPNMDGYTLTRRIKADNILKKIPVVIFSSMINADILHKGNSVGADAQLSKPQIGELIQTVSSVIKNSLGS